MFNSNKKGVTFLVAVVAVIGVVDMCATYKWLAKRRKGKGKTIPSWLEKLLDGCP